jgi:hypothetical protein
MHSLPALEGFFIALLILVVVVIAWIAGIVVFRLFKPRR